MLIHLEFFDGLSERLNFDFGGANEGAFVGVPDGRAQDADDDDENRQHDQKFQQRKTGFLRIQRRDAFHNGRLLY